MLYDEFIRSFSKFRKSWFNNPNKKNLNELWHYLNFCKNELAPNILKDLFFLNKNLRLYDYKNEDAKLLLEGRPINGNHSFFLNLVFYSSFDGYISSHLSKILFTNISIKDINQDFKKILSLRISLINQCYDFRRSWLIPIGDLWTFGIAPLGLSKRKKVIFKVKQVIKNALKNKSI